MCRRGLNPVGPHRNTEGLDMTCTDSTCLRVKHIAETETLLEDCSNIDSPARFDKLSRLWGRLMATPCSYYCDPADPKTEG